MTKAQEKARQLRYKKPIVRDLNLWKIREDLDEISEACDSVRYYWESDEDTLINAMDGDEDEAYEFKMMFADLCAECDQMREDLEEQYVPNCFDILFVAAGAGEFGGGYLGWDSYEQDYFGIECADDFAKGEGAKQLKRLTKDRLIDCTHACLKVLYEYLGLKNRYDNLKAAFDILRDANTGRLQIARKIEELYGEAEEESRGFVLETGKVRELNAMFDALPPEAWL
mgnify:CR=1 FL=1